MIKGSIQEEDITIVNIYASNIGAPQYIRQMITDIKGEIDSNTILVGHINTSLIPSDHSIQMQKNTLSSQLQMEHSPGKTTSWVTNQTSVNIRKFKSYQASFLTITL